ncbi:MAG TPA: GNAT family N-acetyltransferase [Acidimicrobiales bacterium]|nr:GNAT family N-acetyltransferase [Acidimicrobiales bacterium]
MEVRRRTDADLDVCVDLATVVHERDGYPRFLPAGGDLRPFLSSSTAIGAWVAVEGRTIVGHVAVHRRASEPVMALATRTLGCEPDGLGVVARLLVAPTARRAGVGRRLLDHASAEATAAGLLPVLDVVTDHVPAITLYERCGWVRVGTVRTTLGVGMAFDEHVYLHPDAVGGAGGPATGRRPD